jgi:subtilase family serine protease
VNRAHRSTVALLSGAALIAAAATATAGAASAATRVTLAGSQPSWATAAHRQGSTPGSTPVDFKVYMPLRNPSAAEQLALAVSTRGSGSTGKFLTSQQFRSRYAPAASQVSAVRSWLTDQGFKVTDVATNNRYVEATGTAATAAAAFKTGFAEYKVAGRTLRSNTSALSVPSNLGVQAVTGLDESYALVQTHANPPAGFRNAQPCSTYWGEKTVANTSTPDGTQLPADPSAFAPCGYAGEQLQGAYGVDSAIHSGNDGSGVTVAVIDAYASPTVFSDLNTYSKRHGLPTVSRSQLTEVVAPGTYRRPQNPRQDPEGWSGEETLDIEAVHTMAPGAHIVYVGSPTTTRTSTRR